ncbi:MAG: M14 family metallopeptidase [Candidatus Cloacimonetes bacterium]|jgi:hypothetical protein|nr:M14 family metallopeptidase [Candidatus Cloacimonadota bacterium]MDD2505781.1 M14 family metallopeptidase [Candidatus Cloacimonadota bacterium]MDD4148158.1 M14 family metallopeptidase [Candidatus Cloacimonadota bacterium]MDD4559203.1 M14 family metallopeptidase [Candidatus Cloacimonadota bacterium]
MKPIQGLAIWLGSMFLITGCVYQGINQYPFSSALPRYHDLLPFLNSIIGQYPGSIEHRILGFSGTEHLPIYAVEIGKGNRNILIIGQHHADELLGLAISQHMIRELSSGGQSDAGIRAVLEEYRIWIVPSINPEGWRVVSDGSTRVKRKNNRDTDENGKLDLRTDGVDLNRNYPVFWDQDTEVNHMSSYYKGSDPSSEDEVKAIISLSRKIPFELAIFYHSSITGALNERIFLPAVAEESSSYLKLQELAEFYAAKVPRDYYRGTYTVHRGSSSRVGNARNFFYHSQNAAAMLIEVGGVNRWGQSITHPSQNMVERINKRHFKAFMALLKYMSAG